MQVNGQGEKKLARKKSLAVGVACVAIFGPVPGSTGRTFEFWVLNKWVFNFCVRSIPLEGNRDGQMKTKHTSPK